MFSYNYDNPGETPIIPEGVKTTLAWIAAYIAVALMWTAPAWMILLGWI